MGLLEAMSEDEYADFVEMFFDVMSPLDRVETFDLLREWFCAECGRTKPEPHAGKTPKEHVCKGKPLEEDEDEDDDEDDAGDDREPIDDSGRHDPP